MDRETDTLFASEWRTPQSGSRDGFEGVESAFQVTASKLPGFSTCEDTIIPRRGMNLKVTVVSRTYRQEQLGNLAILEFVIPEAEDLVTFVSEFWDLHSSELIHTCCF